MDIPNRFHCPASSLPTTMSVSNALVPLAAPVGVTPGLCDGEPLASSDQADPVAQNRCNATHKFAHSERFLQSFSATWQRPIGLKLFWFLNASLFDESVSGHCRCKFCSSPGDRHYL
jgi:hypothetical protein